MTEPRDRYFDMTKKLITEYYLSDPDDPFRQSGRGCGHQRWDDTRRFFADLVNRPGSYLDVGCANGLLLESLSEWVVDHDLTLFGVDLVPELVDLARIRVPSAEFWVANAWDWVPPRVFTHVRTNLEYVPDADAAELVRRHARWVEPGGRLVVSHYPAVDEPSVDVDAVVREAGLNPVGVIAVDRIRAAWWDAAP